MGVMEFLIGMACGIALTLLVFLLLSLWNRRRAVKNQAPPFRWRGGGPSGVREPRRPLVPAGSASAELPLDALEQIEEIVVVAGQGRTPQVIIEKRRGKLRRTA